MRRKNTPSQLFDQIESKSVSIEVVAQIENLILSGVLNEGDMLPGERELAEQFGISRPKVREALSQLAESQLLYIVANDGAYVAKLAGDVMSPALVALFNRSASAIRDNLEYRRGMKALHRDLSHSAQPMKIERNSSACSKRSKQQMRFRIMRLRRSLIWNFTTQLHSRHIIAHSHI